MLPETIGVSKSTQRYGKVLMTARTFIDASPEPPKKVLRQLAKYDSAAKKQFGKNYESLTNKEKEDLHLRLAVRRGAEKRERELKDMESDAAYGRT